MSKISDFYAKVMSDEKTKSELESILDGKPIEKASGKQMKKIGKLAEDLGFDITAEEAKNYLKNDNSELDMDDLDSVAGGKYNNDNSCTGGNISTGNQGSGGNPGSNNSADVNVK